MNNDGLPGFAVHPISNDVDIKPRGSCYGRQIPSILFHTSKLTIVEFAGRILNSGAMHNYSTVTSSQANQALPHGFTEFPEPRHSPPGSHIFCAKVIGINCISEACVPAVARRHIALIPAGCSESAE